MRKPPIRVIITGVDVVSGISYHQTKKHRDQSSPCCALRNGVEQMRAGEGEVYASFGEAYFIEENGKTRTLLGKK